MPPIPPVPYSTRSKNPKPNRMKAALLLAAGFSLTACEPAGEAGPEPATMGEQRALKDAQEMIEQHAEGSANSDQPKEEAAE